MTIAKPNVSNRLKSVDGKSGETEPFNDDAEAPYNHRGSDKRAEETHAICQDHGEVGANGIEAAMRQIDYAAERKDQRETERDQKVIRADQKAIQNLLEDENILHAKNSARKESKQFRAP
jgi:hypothetical protein